MAACRRLSYASLCGSLEVEPKSRVAFAVFLWRYRHVAPFLQSSEFVVAGPRRHSILPRVVSSGCLNLATERPSLNSWIDARASTCGSVRARRRADKRASRGWGQGESQGERESQGARESERARERELQRGGKAIRDDEAASIGRGESGSR